MGLNMTRGDTQPSESFAQSAYGFAASGGACGLDCRCCQSLDLSCRHVLGELQRWEPALGQSLHFDLRFCVSVDAIRVVVDQCLQGLGLQTSDLKAYAHEENSHHAVIAGITAGRADMGLGIACTAQVHGLDFVALYPDLYGLVCLASFLESEPVKQLRALLGDPLWLECLQTIASDTTTTDAGQLQSLSCMLP